MVVVARTSKCTQRMKTFSQFKNYAVLLLSRRQGHSGTLITFSIYLFTKVLRTLKCGYPALALPFNTRLQIVFIVLVLHSGSDVKKTAKFFEVSFLNFHHIFC